MKEKLWNEPDFRLLERCKEGDEKALTELLVAFTPLVRYIARGFAEASRNEVEDLIQEGYISILHAVKGHERARGKFSSYSFSCVRNRMISFLRKNKDRSHTVSLSEETTRILASRMTCDEKIISDQFEQEIFSCLSCLETTVLDSFLETGSISGVSLILKWPRKKVDNALQRIRKKLSGKTVLRL